MEYFNDHGLFDREIFGGEKMTAEKFLGRVGKWAPEDMWPCVRVNSRGLGDGKVGGGAGSYEVGSTEKCR